MAAEPRVVRSVLPWIRRWLGKLGLRQMLQIGFAVILAATALFGGLDSVNTKVTPFEPGEPFSDGEFTITIHRATAVDEFPSGTAVAAPPTPGRRYLGVVATVRNDGTVPGRLQDEIDLRGQPDKKFLGALRMSDSSLITSLGPGLTEEVAFIWQLPRSAVQPGNAVTLRVWHKKFQELAVSYGKDWIDSTEYGEIQLVVGTKP